jgi:hypothetical protein
MLAKRGSGGIEEVAQTFAEQVEPEPDDEQSDAGGQDLPP